MAKKNRKSKKKKKSKIQRKIILFFTTIFGVGTIAFFTPLFTVIDDATGGTLTSVWNTLAKVEDDVNNNNREPEPPPVDPTEDYIIDKNIGLPAFAPSDKNVIRHRDYTLRYNEKHEQAEWVAYTLIAAHLKGNNERKDHFRADPAVPSETARSSDYRGSGYDRGHLAPAADFRYSKEAIDESFFMSNMSPQAPAFNRGIWKGLEEKVRTWAKERKKIYIVTGPILKKHLRKLGTSTKISIPKQFYKIVLDLSNPMHPKSVAFLMPNKLCEGNYMDYVTSIDIIEKLTSIDFFPKLPNDIETMVEQKSSADGWVDQFEAVPSPVGDFVPLPE